MHFFRLIFALVWLGIGVAVLLRKTLGIEDWFRNQNDTMMHSAGILAIAFAVHQLVRWSMRLVARPEVGSALDLPDRPRFKPEHEYHPEFDFDANQSSAENEPRGDKPPPRA